MRRVFVLGVITTLGSVLFMAPGARGQEELGPPPEAELKALVRTRRILTLRTWLMGFGIAFTAIALALRFTFHEGRLSNVRLVLFDEPVTLGSVLLAGVACWIAYAALGARLRTRPPHAD